MKDTSPEVRRMQIDMMRRLGTNRRIELAAEMFMAARELMYRSYPKDLTDKELKSRLFRDTYGEDLPSDFFKKKNDV